MQKTLILLSFGSMGTVAEVDIMDLLRQIWGAQLYKSGEVEVQLNQLVISLLLVMVGGAIARFLSSMLGRRLKHIAKLNQHTAYVLQRIAFYIMLIVVVLVALPIAGIPITIFTVLGGALAIGVGFGAQNLFNNLISGIIIVTQRPIRIGDIVEIDDSEGRVEELGNRCVRVRRTDGVDLLVPNSYFLENTIANWTLFDNDIRGSVSVGVAYGSPTERVRDLILRAAQEHPKINKSPDPIVLFTEFGDNSLNFELLFWTSVQRPMDLRRIQSDLRYRIDAFSGRPRSRFRSPSATFTSIRRSRSRSACCEATTGASAGKREPRGPSMDPFGGTSARCGTLSPVARPCFLLR